MTSGNNLLAHNVLCLASNTLTLSIKKLRILKLTTQNTTSLQWTAGLSGKQLGEDNQQRARGHEQLAGLKTAPSIAQIPVAAAQLTLCTFRTLRYHRLAGLLVTEILFETASLVAFNCDVSDVVRGVQFDARISLLGAGNRLLGVVTARPRARRVTIVALQGKG